MGLRINASDEEWESAAIAEMRADVRGYPGGAKQFVNDHRERLGIRYEGFLDNLSGKNRISYRTFTRTVHILGYALAEYDEKIIARIVAQRRAVP
jgi:hypothetical protein